MRIDAILDTDIGGDPDDLFALLLAVNSPEIDLKLVVTGDEVSGKRAIFARKILDSLDRRTRVVQGVDLGNPYRFVVDELIADSKYDISTDYLSALKSAMDSSEKIVYICIQGMSNLASLLKAFPEAKGKLSVYQMGGVICDSPRMGWAQHNLKIDPESARYVLHSGCEIHFVGSQTTANPALTVDDRHEILLRLRQSSNEAHRMLVRHCELYNKAFGVWPNMHDPLTVAAAMGKDFVSFYESSISIYGDGGMSVSKEGARAYLSHGKSQAREFMQFLSERLFTKTQ